MKALVPNYASEEYQTPNVKSWDKCQWSHSGDGLLSSVVRPRKFANFAPFPKLLAQEGPRLLSSDSPPPLQFSDNAFP